MTYLAGTLELMSSSTLHEDAKTIIGRLIEVWAMEQISISAVSVAPRFDVKPSNAV